MTGNELSLAAGRGRLIRCRFGDETLIGVVLASIIL